MVTNGVVVVVYDKSFLLDLCFFFFFLVPSCKLQYNIVAKDELLYH